MLDNPLFVAIIAALRAGFTARGITADQVAIMQDYQPTQQGVNEMNTVYVHKLFDQRRGQVKRETAWNSETGVEQHIETQWYESTFQISATVIVNPKDTAPMTASDLVNIACGTMQSDTTIDSFLDLGLGLLRVSDVVNPYFTDDKGRFEAKPSFDFTLEHEQVIISETPVAESVELHIARV